ncbi:MAG: hypothetical protein A3J48_01245 [Candidatus Doudnabacteria bacterium RIFCSPHIGHO2_02_FULL_46_11]|uniref:Uncharacterized protein n=1 Tax=Candidatus Doudnabacteria bacterium RIFCSPHIGHO2_02_FULL_46_11 TaxID=1817832 RepID=A0A1F5P4J9_9BACT|nr:MAG: hypothetical protein A3J48_01245 [Candidatus Doudnabacteria bacterium RIFCSPHIGHO2_02_FULL_46_11]
MSRPNINSLIEKINPTDRAMLTDRQIAALKNTGQVVLVLVAIAGALTVAGAAPGVLRALSRSSWARRQLAGCGPTERKKRMNKELRRAL